MIARISGIIGESIVDGTGLRTTIFFQGCPHGCPGCHNPQTHDPNEGEEKELDTILEDIKKNPLLDGVTLSGGEPFFQAAAAADFAKKAHEQGLNVWTYTGYCWEEILQAENPDWMKLLQCTDVLVDGRFIQKERTLDMPFVGSRNQRVIDVEESLKTNKIVLHAFSN